MILMLHLQEQIISKVLILLFPILMGAGSRVYVHLSDLRWHCRLHCDDDADCRNFFALLLPKLPSDAYLFLDRPRLDIEALLSAVEYEVIHPKFLCL